LKFIQTTQDVIDDSTMEVVINYFERLFMCEEKTDDLTESIKSTKRTATTGE
jgi:hypothetical protein